MRSFLKTLVAGLAIVTQVANALPQPVEDATAVQDLDRRAPAAAPTTKAVAGHTGVYVPMMYAAYLDAKTGAWTRYQCDDSKGKEIKTTGTVTGNEKQAVTDGLASCVSVSLITTHGVLKTHVPPYLCPVIKRTKKDDKGLNQQLKNLKAAIKALVKAHKKDLEKATTVAVSGSYSKEAEVKTILTNLFDTNGPLIQYKLEVPVDPTNDHRSTVVDFTTNPAKFYIEGREHPY